MTTLVCNHCSSATINPQSTSPINYSNWLATLPPVAPNNSLGCAKPTPYTSSVNKLDYGLTPADGTYVNKFVWLLPNGKIFVGLPSIRHRISTWKVRRNFIDFERQIHVEILTSVRCGSFNVDSTFIVDEISMSSPHGFFHVVSMLNRRNYCTRCFHSIVF